MEARPAGVHPIRKVVLGFLAVAVMTGVFFSWFASERPDGLEWSITKVTGQEGLKGEENGLHVSLAALQKSLAFLPDYSFKKAEEAESNKKAVDPGTDKAEEKKPEGSRLGTSVSGIVGGTITLALCFLIGFILKKC